jgi:spore maturation protein CgeB
MRVVILGLSITSSWGNGHATNYRALVRALAQAGDEVLFLERDVPWYAAHRDLPEPPGGRTRLYGSLEGLRSHRAALREADLVILGSFVPEGVAVGEWVLSTARGAVAFYDIDTPVTIAKLRARDHEYLSAALAARFDLYLSFTGGPALELLAEEFGVRSPHAFHCFVDPDAYRPVEVEPRWALSYLGTYAAGRQPALEALLLEVARRRPERRFAVGGAMYPPEVRWPENVERFEHVAPGEHPRFYCASELTLNLTRPEMRALGHSPSVRLFEAAACARAIVSDPWPGLEGVLEPGAEVLVAERGEEVLALLDDLAEAERRAIGEAARARVLAEHTAAARVALLHELVGAGEAVR